MSAPKLCVECKHFAVNAAFGDRAESLSYGMCGRPAVINKVTGKADRYASTERNGAAIFGTCGKRGRFWEAK